MSDIFRALFGFPKKETTKKGNDFPSSDGQDEGLSSMFDKMPFGMPDIFKQFDDLYATIFSENMNEFFGSLEDSLQSMEKPFDYTPAIENFSDEKNPRDKMLKAPDENPGRGSSLDIYKPKPRDFWSGLMENFGKQDFTFSDKKDSDLDSFVKDNGIDSILNTDVSQIKPERKFVSTFKSYSYSKGADGTSRQSERRRLEDGTTEEIVRVKTREGRSWEETTVRDKAGNVIRNERTTDCIDKRTLLKDDPDESNSLFKRIFGSHK